ncbi:MAG: hypothetical protein ACRYHQ_20860, partial [Janthinobacterium lividum]
RAAIQQSFAGAGLEVSTSGYGSVFSLWFAATPPTVYEAAQALVNVDRATALHLALRRHGVIAMPSPWGRIYLSFKHDEEALGILRDAFSRAAAVL